MPDSGLNKEAPTGRAHFFG